MMSSQIRKTIKKFFITADNLLENMHPFILFGHAVMAYLNGIDDFRVVMEFANPRVVTLSPVYTEEDVKNYILIYYSGAIAEELLIGKIGIGSMNGPDSDFEKVKKYIKSYIVMVDKTVSKSLLDEELTDQIIKYSKKFYQMAYNILSEHIDMVRRISDALAVNDTLSKGEIEKLLTSLQ